MNWLEGTEHFTAAHDLTDQIGAYVRRILPRMCALERRDRGFMQTCPVSLAHVRVGFSAEMLVREIECSICGQDPRDCEHLSGVEYDGKVAVSIVKQAEMLGVSLVSRPRQPDARIIEQSVSNNEVRDALGFDPSPDVEVLCDRCLTRCPGVKELPGAPLPS